MYYSPRFEQGQMRICVKGLYLIIGIKRNAKNVVSAFKTFNVKKIVFFQSPFFVVGDKYINIFKELKKVHVLFFIGESTSHARMKG